MKVNFLVFCLFVVLIDVKKFAKTASLQKWKDLNFAEAANLQKWEAFKKEFNKHYATPEEEQRRRTVFEENFKMIAKHNKMFRRGHVSYDMQMNQFGDMTEEELKEGRCDITLSEGFDKLHESLKGESVIHVLPPGSGTPPEYKNWKAEGAVTPAEHQGYFCGSCWAFSVAAAIESHYFIRTKELVALSPQNLLDCVGEHFNMSEIATCSSGIRALAYQYVVDNKGIATKKSYPYIGKQGVCRDKVKKKIAAIKGFKKLGQRSEKLLKDIVGVIGPVTVSIDCEDSFDYHKTGIFKEQNVTKSESAAYHGVLVVGYGTENNEPYWLVKNSWGSEWGEMGYFKLSRGTNECNILSRDMHYPVFFKL